MELNIGPNIKRLRLAKGITQEQLAGLLSVSTAAVSKWEARNTYPDVTLLFPLASIFGVSVDELMGYDEATEREEIDRVIAACKECARTGEYEKRAALIRRARKKYPHDFRLMDLYLWELAGGQTNGDPQTLLRNKDEVIRLSDCILDGCTQDDLRADALTLKAKLLHADGKTDEAIATLKTLPAWHSPIAIEQLFAKDTPEFRHWNRRNCYGLLDVFAIRFARTVSYDPDLSTPEKIARLEGAAGRFAAMAEQSDTAFFCIAEQAILAIAAGLLNSDDVGTAIRLREKQFAAMRKMTSLAEHDEVMKECIFRTYHPFTPVGYLVNQLTNSTYPPLAKLRGNGEYRRMIERNGE